MKAGKSAIQPSLICPYNENMLVFHAYWSNFHKNFQIYFDEKCHNSFYCLHFCKHTGQGHYEQFCKIEGGGGSPSLAAAGAVVWLSCLPKIYGDGHYCGVRYWKKSLELVVQASLIFDLQNLASATSKMIILMKAKIIQFP